MRKTNSIGSGTFAKTVNAIPMAKIAAPIAKRTVNFLSSVVNLMKQTLTINVAQTAADTIASQIETIVHGHEPDMEVSEIVQESYIPEKKQEANE